MGTQPMRPPLPGLMLIVPMSHQIEPFIFQLMIRRTPKTSSATSVDIMNLETIVSLRIFFLDPRVSLINPYPLLAQLVPVLTPAHLWTKKSFWKDLS